VIDISFEAIIEPPCLNVTEVIPYPLATVWLAETEGLYVKQWWAPTDYENVEVDLTLEPGGAWRVLQRDPQGNQFAFYGKVEQVIKEELLVISLTSELYPDFPLLISQEFAATPTGTVVLSRYKFETQEALNTYLALGGPERLKGASARLDALLSQLTS
jgi:uncharacterized protein YndB with AHSA1/START domain